MSSSRRRDFSLFGEEFDNEVKQTNNRDFRDLEDLDGILSQSLDLFEERRHSLESPNQVDSDGRCIAAGKNTIDRKGENCLNFR